MCWGGEVVAGCTVPSVLVDTVALCYRCIRCNVKNAQCTGQCISGALICVVFQNGKTSYVQMWWTITNGRMFLCICESPCLSLTTRRKILLHTVVCMCLPFQGTIAVWSTLLFVVVSLCRVKGVLKDFVLWDRLHSHSSSVTSPHSKEVLVCTLVEDEGKKVGFTSEHLSLPSICPPPCTVHFIGDDVIINTLGIWHTVFKLK